MLKIGEFSILSRISIHMLRHYNEIGLLIPISIDKFTGYRYYSEDQLPTANKIQALKNMGMSLEIIKDVINNCEDIDSIKIKLTNQKYKKEEEIKILQQQLLNIESALKTFESGSDLLCDISVKEIPERYVASCRNLISFYNQEGILWEILNAEMVKQKVEYSNPQFNSAIFYEDSSNENYYDVEVQKAVTGKYQDNEHVKFKKLKSVKVAALIYKGGYYKLQNINQAIANWIVENNYELDGNIFNIYHRSPETEMNPDNLITEVCFPINVRIR
jgi:DNA-binding transcriptional MerR regulator